MAKHIQAIDLRAKERNLINEIPLPAPYSLYVEPTSLCNLRCAFCPTGDKVLRQQRPNGLMPYSLWCKIVNDLRDWGVKLRKVNVYKDGEPLVHRQFPDMIRYMKDAGVSDAIWTKTNGLSLTPFLNDRIAKCGLDMIGISVQHVNPDGYKQIADVRIDYEKFVANIADLYNRREGMKVYIKIADSGLSEADKRKFYDDFSPIADYVAVEQLHGWAASDAKDFTLGTNPTTFEGAPLVDKIVCPLPFYMLGINWNGTVSLCNEDWRHETIVGDLNQQTIREVWEGDALKRMRLMHLEGRRGENGMCRNCNYLKTLIDNLDSKRKELARRIA